MLKLVQQDEGENMITLNNLQKYIDKLMNFDPKLDIGKIDTHMANGLMVKGRQDIKKIGFAVSASIKVFEAAKEKSCDCLVVHHIFNLPKDFFYDPIFQNRYSYLIKNEITLFGYHFLLDSHPTIGNNSVILKTIGCKPKEYFYHGGDPWGWKGEYEKDISLEKIIEILTPLLSSRMLTYAFGPEKIKKVAAVSGKGAPNPGDMKKLIEDKIDLFITGEIHEWNRELFREASINCIAGGHYHTERFGIMALMEKMKKDLIDVETEWLELENEV